MRTAIISTLLVLSACNDKNPATPDAAPDAGADQTPPQGKAALESWLAEGMYKSWATEAGVHASRSPSPHGYNRIYSNDLIAQNAAGTGAWPKGAAAVKELYDSLTATTPSGYSVYLKLADDSAGGANWYWFERLPGGTLVADGTGSSGSAKTICVACHVAAGTDLAHTPTPGGRDEVYTPVSR